MTRAQQLRERSRLRSVVGRANTISNPGSTADRTLTIEITVVDENGDPVSGVPVLLQDRGGTPDDRQGATGSDGVIIFVEDVGPPPCNTQTIILPDHGVEESLGCNNGGKTISRTLSIAGGSQQNGGGDAEQQASSVEVTEIRLPNTPTQGATVTGEFTVETTGDEPASTEMPVFVDGEQVASFSLNVSNVSPETYSFDYQVPCKRDYTVTVGAQEVMHTASIQTTGPCDTSGGNGGDGGVSVTDCSVSDTSTGAQFSATVENTTSSTAGVTVRWETTGGTVAAEAQDSVAAGASQQVSTTRSMSDLRAQFGEGQITIANATVTV